MDSSLDLLFYIVFILCGVIVGSLTEFPKNVLITLLFVIVSFVIGNPFCGLIFFLGMLVASLVVDFINSAQGRRGKKEVISI